MAQRKIMVAIDSSEDSKRAFEYALDNVVKPERDTLFILHARLLIPMALPGAGTDYMVNPEIWREVQKKSEEESEGLVKSYLDIASERKVSCKGFSVEGDARDVILEEASREEIDILVLGSRGLGAMKRALLGSVSGHLVSNARCPTLIVRQNTNKEVEDGNRTILFAVDESENSRDAFKWALENVCHSETDQLIIMTAQPMSPWTSYTEFTTLELEEKIEKETLERKREVLLSLNKEAKKMGVHCMMEIVRGDAREAILWAADKYKADLLVMGNRGLSPFSRMFMGSVSSYCCHNVSCPILVVKSEPKFEPETVERASLVQLKVE